MSIFYKKVTNIPKECAQHFALNRAELIPIVHLVYCCLNIFLTFTKNQNIFFALPSLALH